MEAKLKQFLLKVNGHIILCVAFILEIITFIIALYSEVLPFNYLLLFLSIVCLLVSISCGNDVLLDFKNFPKYDQIVENNKLIILLFSNFEFTTDFLISISLLFAAWLATFASPSILQFYIAKSLIYRILIVIMVLGCIITVAKAINNYCLDRIVVG